MDVLQSFKKTVLRHQLFDKSHKLLIACSGGADSIALCHICHQLGYDIAIAHVNYQLRDEDAEEDAQFVEMKANKLKINLHSKTIDCSLYAADHDMSIQEAARKIRYDYFDSIMAIHDYDYLLTGHHAKDNVETMLYTLSKGASLTALRGIPISRENIRRPLLYSTKTAIDLYLRRNNINHRHDISNDETKYKRNYIRHEIIPRLEQINPNLESTLSRTSMLGSGYQLLLDAMLIDQKTQFLDSKKLDLAQMLSNPARFVWLYEMIRTLGFNFNDALDIWATTEQEHSTGKSFQAGDNLITINRGQLQWSSHEANDIREPLVINSIQTVGSDSKGRFAFKILEQLPSKNGAYFDLEKIAFPLTIRRWQAGDRFKPSGMQGKRKKVKDYLTDQKVSGAARIAVEVMLNEDEIIWVVGYRMADGYKANDGASSILSVLVK